MPNYTLIDPKVDFAFKRLFGSSIHPAPLLDFINAVLDAFNEPPVSAISVLDFTLFARERLHSLYEIRERYDHDRLSDLLQMYIIELPKMSRVEVPPHLQQWVEFLQVKSETDLERLSTGNKAIREVGKMLSEMSQDPDERALYEMRRKAMLDYNTNIEGAREEGREEGLEEGREEGALRMLLTIAESQFGVLSMPTLERLKHCDVEQIDRLSKALLGAYSLEDWLKNL